MKFAFVNLNWKALVSKKTYKIHLSLPPLDLLILKNFAEKQGHSVALIDLFVDETSSLQSRCADADWIIVTTTPYAMWQCPNAEWDMIKQGLRIFPKNKVVLCGLHSSAFPEMTLRETEVFAVIRREPETAFSEFLVKQRWQDCGSVSYLDGSAYIENSFSTPLSMDSLAVESYDVDISRYGYFLLGQRTGVFEASRGCPWKCTFCDQEMFDWKYRNKSPEVFADEVRRAVSRTRMKTAYFFDLEFTIQKKRNVEICQALIARKVHKDLRWACQTRADMVDDETLEALWDAGCRLIHFGVESANPSILEATNKKITLETIRDGVGRAKRKGFETACFFMFGLPDEKAEEFRNTLEFARDLNPTYASFHFAVPFPGTPLYQRFIDEGRGAWGDWPGIYFNGWDREQIHQFLKRAFIRFYLQPKRWEARQFLHRLNNLGPKISYFRSIAS